MLRRAHTYTQIHTHTLHILPVSSSQFICSNTEIKINEIHAGLGSEV